MTNGERLLLRVKHYRAFRPCRAAKERMPFPGHRTMAEIMTNEEEKRQCIRRWRKARRTLREEQQ